MLAGPRLRQVALVAADCAGTARRLQETFNWPDPFHDRGISRFGLTNVVFAAGDTFVEVVSPVQPATTAGRYLQRRGGDSGYMAIFQLPDLAAARRRVAEAGIRVVWQADYADIAGTPIVLLKHAGQDLRFAPAAPGRADGITEVRLSTETEMPPVEIAGVRFVPAARTRGGESA